MKTRRLLAIYVFFPDALASLQSGLSVRPFLLSKGPEDTNDCLCIQILHLSDVRSLPGEEVKTYLKTSVLTSNPHNEHQNINCITWSSIYFIYIGGQRLPRAEATRLVLRSSP